MGEERGRGGGGGRTPGDRVGAGASNGLMHSLLLDYCRFEGNTACVCLPVVDAGTMQCVCVCRWWMLVPCSACVSASRSCQYHAVRVCLQVVAAGTMQCVCVCRWWLPVPCSACACRSSRASSVRHTVTRVAPVRVHRSVTVSSTCRT